MYLGRCALRYAKATGEAEDTVVSRFNGLVRGVVPFTLQYRSVLFPWFVHRGLWPCGSHPDCWDLQFFSSFQFNGFIGSVVAAVAFNGASRQKFNKVRACVVTCCSVLACWRRPPSITPPSVADMFFKLLVMLGSSD